MYQVIHRGNIIQRYDLFVDAWLYVVLELPCFARIKGPDGTWTINPIRININ
jgi:hypothetical protein